ncbi:MAG: hypothetical protein ACRENX_05245 [Candidatus Dormibacteria bacterium]
MTTLLVKELGQETWAAFERVVEKHPGIWGGCCFLTFDLQTRSADRTLAQNRAGKGELVRSNLSHAASVYDGTDIAGWFQFGTPIELPDRRTACPNLGVGQPEWRITCFFADREDRRGGLPSRNRRPPSA